MAGLHPNFQTPGIFKLPVPVAPFTGMWVASNLNSTSPLDEYGWPGEGLSLLV